MFLLELVVLVLSPQNEFFVPLHLILSVAPYNIVARKTGLEEVFGAAGFDTYNQGFMKNLPGSVETASPPNSVFRNSMGLWVSSDVVLAKDSMIKALQLLRFGPPLI